MRRAFNAINSRSAPQTPRSSANTILSMLVGERHNLGDAQSVRESSSQENVVEEVENISAACPFEEIVVHVDDSCPQNGVSLCPEIDLSLPFCCGDLFDVADVESDAETPCDGDEIMLDVSGTSRDLFFIMEDSDESLSSSPESSHFMSEEKYIKLGDNGRTILGRGSSGLVFCAVEPETHEVVALKETPLGYEDGISQVQNEIRIISGLTRQERRHFVHVSDSAIYGGALTSVTSYMNAGTLASLIENRANQVDSFPVLEEEVIGYVARQVLTGLAVLHNRSRPVIHNDLKPANILLSRDGRVKMCDFGLSRRLENVHNFVEDCKGTLRYMAPEKFGRYNCQVDLWAFGITLYECIVGPLPVDITGRFTQFTPEEDKLANVSTELRDLILQCLTEDHELRPTASQLLNHRFFRHQEPFRWDIECSGPFSGEELLMEILERTARIDLAGDRENVFLSSFDALDDENMWNICVATGLDEVYVQRAVSAHRRMCR